MLAVDEFLSAAERVAQGGSALLSAGLFAAVDGALGIVLLLLEKLVH